MVPLCVMWSIWQERNTRSFDDCERGLTDLKKLVLQTLYLWRVAWPTPNVSNFFEFIDLCSFASDYGSFVYFLYTWVAPLCPLFEYTLFFKKMFRG
jgi:hypothetical protein